MNKSTILLEILRKNQISSLENFSSSLKYNLKKDSLINSSAWRQRLRRSPRSERRRSRWTRRVLLGSAAVGVVGGVSMLSSESAVGPIYKFESSEDYGLPLDYDIPAMEQYFRSRPGEVLMRTGEILSEVVPFFSRLFIWEYWIRRKIREHEGLQKKYAVELREMLTRLGPSFIKFGQAMSIRPDLLPSSFLFELQKLCDAVPSYPTKDAIAVIESELGEHVSEVFEDLDNNTAPIAAASLGQVYKVKLVREDRIVAVKVQRPDMHHYVLRDIFILRNVAKTIQFFKSVFTYQRPFDVALLDTFANATLKELDYLNEASNQRKCKEALEPRLKERIYIPEVFDKHTTRKVRKI